MLEKSIFLVGNVCLILDGQGGKGDIPQPWECLEEVTHVLR